MAAKSFRTSNDLPARVRGQVVPILNQQLADTTDLYSQVKTAHWNVKGLHFIALHELFDKLASELTEQADTVAERVTALGGLAVGTLRQAAGTSRLAELPASTVEGQALLKALVERYAALAAATRSAIDATTAMGDAGSADLLTGLSRELDKSLWFLEAHLQGRQA